MGGLSIRAVGLGVRTRQGPVFDGFSMNASVGTLTAICGPAGSGRSALLMTLAGRMKFSEGDLVIGDRVLPKAGRWVRERSSIAPMGGFLALEPGLRVQEEVNRARWLAGHKNLRTGYSDAALVAGLDAKRKTLIRDLSAVDRNKLAIASAFVQANAQMVIFDDLGSGVARDDQAELWHLLRLGIDATGVTAVASSLEFEPAEGIADAVIKVGRPATPAVSPPEVTA